MATIVAILSLVVDPAKGSGPELHQLTWVNPKKLEKNI
jgi:hypothetical protein